MDTLDETLTGTAKSSGASVCPSTSVLHFRIPNPYARASHSARPLAPPLSLAPRPFCKACAVTMRGVNARVSTAKVSHRGQTSLPAGLRRRWGIEAGGEVAFVDLGNAALVLPGGVEAARAELRRVLLSGAYEDAVASIDDPELADQ